MAWLWDRIKDNARKGASHVKNGATWTASKTGDAASWTYNTVTVDNINAATEKMAQRSEALAEKVENLKDTAGDLNTARKELSAATGNLVKEIPGAKTTASVAKGGFKMLKFGAWGAAAVAGLGALAYVTSGTRNARKFDADKVPMPEPLPTMPEPTPQMMQAEPAPVKTVQGPFSAKELAKSAAEPQVGLSA